VIDVALLLLAVAIGTIWFWLDRRGRSDARERELRHICLGNEQQAKRLIDSEMSRAAGISRAEAARRAIERYRRDNR
jgi:hypothetical protein